MSTSRSSGTNQRIADRLLAEGRIQRDQHQSVVDYSSRHRTRVEEALIELEIMSEADLLKFIATTHATRFVSTERLSKAVIEPRVLARVPLRTADLHGVFPVLYDDKAGALSVVTADPDNDAALHEVKLTAQVREVRALAARPAAVRAAIALHYRNDRAAFGPLLRPSTGFDLLNSDPFERRDGQGERQRAQTVQQPPPAAMQTPVPPPNVPVANGPPNVGNLGNVGNVGNVGNLGMPNAPPNPMVGWQQAPQGWAPPGWQQPPPGWQQAPPGWPMAGPQQMQPQMSPMPMQGPAMQGWGPVMPMQAPQGPQGWPTVSERMPERAPERQDRQERQPDRPQAQPRAERTPTPTKIDFGLGSLGSLGSLDVLDEPPKAGSAMGLVQGAGVGAAAKATAAAVSGATVPGGISRKAAAAADPEALPIAASVPFVETLNVLVSLLENARADLRGHSSMVARLTRKTCERIGLPPLQVAAFTAAAYLHDLGKMGAYHLTALNVAEYEGHRVAAMKATDLPLQLMESVGLLPETRAAISAMYERYDGQGIPNGQAGKDIPLGARIIAVADTYADLTQNPRNPYRKILRPFEACEVLGEYRGTIFDPNIVDIFRQSTTGEDMRAKLLSDRHEALIVDPDPEETTVLELRLIEHGFEVKIARNVAQAKRLLAENEIAAVVSEIDLESPDAGLTLRADVLAEGRRDLTWVVLTGKTDRQSAQRAFDLGVDDFVLKPVSTDIFAAKLRQLIERRASSSGGGAGAVRGVSGSLTEMGLPDMVQILWHGRKTCALRISAGPASGEIGFSEGHVIDARWDSRENRDGAGGGLRGEDAFYKMLTLREGDFRVDPSYKPGPRSIQASPEALLLEGMRRLDEASF